MLAHQTINSMTIYAAELENIFTNHLTKGLISSIHKTLKNSMTEKKKQSSCKMGQKVQQTSLKIKNVNGQQVYEKNG